MSVGEDDLRQFFDLKRLSVEKEPMMWTLINTGL
jgi:hypothetical protein